MSARRLRPAAALLFAVLLAGEASAFMVSGSVTDLAGTGVAGIKVDILDEDVGPDDLLATVYTDANGNYSATITDGWGAPLDANPDVYVSVEWKFQLLPTADYGGHHIVLLGVVNQAGNVKTLTQQFTPAVTSVVADHDPATDLTINVTMSATLAVQGATLVDDLATLRTHVNEALDYYRLNKGTVPWTWNEDLNVHIVTGTITSFFQEGQSFPGEPNDSINICEDDINGAAVAVIGGGFVSDIYHEMGHYVHYRFNGNTFPTTTKSGSHSNNFESDGGFAVIEAWPSYVGDVTDALHGMDGKYAQYHDDGVATGFPANAIWRGDEAAGPTGRDAGGFESGEVIEGVDGAVWWDVHNDALFSAGAGPKGFPTNFSVMFNRKPNDIFEFRDGFITLVGSGTPKAKRLYQILQRHGIVFSRVRFAPDPFGGAQASGAAKEVNGVLFLRGTVNAKVEETSAADLGVKQRVGIGKVALFWKAANDLLNDAPSTFVTGTSFVNFASSIALDTTTVGEGEWELLVKSENADGFQDTFLPSWGPVAGGMPVDNGDPNPTVDSDEKYLKVLGAWYDKDRDPATDAVAQGRVAIDNTPPTVNATVKKTR